MEKEDFLFAEQESENQNNNFAIREILDMFLFNWRWFVLSIVLCIVVAVLYVKQSQKVYTSNTTILIKEDNKTNTQTLNEGKAFSDLVGLKVINNVDNEVYILTSKRLMINVVKSLKLDIDYVTRKELRKVSLYQVSPVECVFSDDIQDMSLAFKINIDGSDNVEIYHFRYGGIAQDAYEDLVLKTKLGNTIDLPIGKVTINKTLFLNKEMIDKEIEVFKSTVDMIASMYSNKISTEIGKNTSVIQLTIQDQNPTRAKDILNTLVTVYNEDAVNDKKKIILNTADFINERLIVLGTELAAEDDNIEKFKKENQLVDISSEVSLNLDESTRYKVESVALQNEIEMANYISDYLKNNNNESSLIPMNSGINNSFINSLIASYNDILLQKDKLAAASSDQNPTVQDLNTMLQQKRQAIVTSLDNAIQTLNIQLKNMAYQEQLAQSNFLEIPTQEKEIINIERQQKIKADLYLYLLQKREENALSLSVVDDNARVIDYAENGFLVSPKKRIVVLLAILIGLLLPFVIFFLYSILNTKIRGIKDLEKLQIPFLGMIPFAHNQPHSDQLKIVVQENGKNSISESFRVLRSNIRFMLNNIEHNASSVFMITSSDPFSGKTFIASNLAISIAQSDKKVVVLDLDLHKRSLTRKLKGKNSTLGISEYLSGELDDVDKIIVKGMLHDRLDVIYAGLQPPNPSELLLSNRLEQLIEILKQRYDFIILDTIPIINLADVYIINRVADLTIYIIREGLADRRQLPEIEKMYSEKRLNNLSILLNSVDEKQSIHGYHYKYSYKYKYGYGYNYDYMYQEEVEPKRFFRRFYRKFRNFNR